MKILCVVGARPNFIKISPLLKAFDSKESIETILVHTGQHYNKEMDKFFFDDLDIKRPDINLGVRSASHAVQTAEIMKRFEPVLEEYKPHIVLVLGDVNSTMASALVASKLGIKIAHVEAGLRSFDRKMPEEINRVVTDLLSDYLFVSEKAGLENLKNEGARDEKMFHVGNIMIDCLVQNMQKIKITKILEKLEVTKKDYIVVTIHRPSNVDHRKNLKSLLCLLKEISKKIKVVFPIHPRTDKNLRSFKLRNILEDSDNIIFTKPLSYLDFLHLVMYSNLVMTDSGGIQSEATYLKIPCITLRKTTEQPVTCELGTNILTGIDPQRIQSAVNQILDNKTTKSQIPPLWDGHTAKRITDILLSHPPI